MISLNKLRDSRNVLFVYQFLAMGDAIFLSPVYKTVKDNIKGIEISVLTNQYAVPFVKAIPFVDKVYPLEPFFGQGISRMQRILRLCLFFRKYSVDTIVLRGDKRISQRGLHLASKVSGLKIVSIGSYLEEEVIETRHIVETYFRILERQGFQIKERGRLYIPTPDSAIQEARKFLGGSADRLAGVAPVSGVKIKSLTPEKTVEMIRRLKNISHNIVLFSASKEFSEKVQDSAGDIPVTVVGQVDFSLLMGIVSLCSIFIGVDTGPTHLSAALGVPTVGLYGPTSGVITGPYSEHGVAIQSDVECPYYRPASHLSPKEKLQECYMEDRCKLDIINCVEKIEVDRVMNAVIKLVERGVTKDG
ncbi:MAG TPA: glycosyltransferase family 9 protein [Nitrospirota bacterium]|nr:glycosyltransferase family 9 protein [Nitrospirota bacterium]